MLVDVARSASQASNLGRVCTSRKNADVTSSTENELANCSALEVQAADQNNATAAPTTTLPMTVGDRGRSGSETTVTATVELSPGPPAVNPSPPRERQVSDNVSHLPLSGSLRRSSTVYIFCLLFISSCSCLCDLITLGKRSSAKKSRRRYHRCCLRFRLSHPQHFTFRFLTVVYFSRYSVFISS